MQLCYQVATPDVTREKRITAYQAPLEEAFSTLSQIGYDGVELMSIDPGRLDRPGLLRLAQDFGLSICMVCTGEVFGQMGLTFTSPDPGIRRAALEKLKELASFAGKCGTNINIGRVRGVYMDTVAREQTEAWAAEALQELCDYALPRRVQVILEEVSFFETNFINTLGEAKRMLDTVQRPNCKLMMDVFHMHIEERDMYRAIADHIGDTVHVHLSDSNRRYPGQAGIDFDRVIQSFCECGYDGNFCTEIVQQPSAPEAAARAYAHLAPLFEKHYGRRP